MEKLYQGHYGLQPTTTETPIGPSSSKPSVSSGDPPDLRAWIFGSGLEDDDLAILASAKSIIYLRTGWADHPLIAWERGTLRPYCQVVFIALPALNSTDRCTWLDLKKTVFSLMRMEKKITEAY
ncbi:hypothetical protein LAZ67_11000844 [Cordylochernes scorpioides]|uniref:Uncharacterized protein n=1 Tax=Cordylochernes scorpioides TaxID=51811 RepID=A0ABY6L2Y3_9ARAC|nr:hypothetical protein LAZ67_11000844 [Cordylochernes scorpioides]